VIIGSTDETMPLVGSAKRAGPDCDEAIRIETIDQRSPIKMVASPSEMVASPSGFGRLLPPTLNRLSYWQCV
jgi:hypothetical protein